jgi:hypothetical protein
MEIFTRSAFFTVDVKIEDSVKIERSERESNPHSREAITGFEPDKHANASLLGRSAQVPTPMPLDTNGLATHPGHLASRRSLLKWAARESNSPRPKTRRLQRPCAPCSVLPMGGGSDASYGRLEPLEG